MKKIFATALIALAPLTGHASEAGSTWTVNDAVSSLHYVTTKKEHVAERHVIDGVRGALSPDGVLTIELDMAGVNSGVDVRDGRLRDILFKVADFPTAVFTAEIDMSEYESLSVGETVEGYVDGELSLVGFDALVDFEVRVTRAGENQVLVSSLGPVLLDATELNLASSVDQLREIAKLPSISYAAPVYFTVAFERN